MWLGEGVWVSVSEGVSVISRDVGFIGVWSVRLGG